MKYLDRIHVGLALAALWLAPAGVLAEGESLSRLEAMETRLMALEDKLAASEATITAQRQLLEQTRPVGASDSALPGFLDNLVIGGYVEASYIYNFENPDAHIGTQGTYQFNNEHDSFQLNAVKLELGKAASEPGTAGFQFDLLFGDNAAVLNNGLAAFYDDDGGSLFGDDQFFIQQAFLAMNLDIFLKFPKVSNRNDLALKALFFYAFIQCPA